MTVKRNLRAIDTYVNRDRPTTNYGKAGRLGVKQGTTYGDQFTYATFTKPFPVGAKITKATLSWTTWGSMSSGTHVFHVTPVISGGEDANISYGRMTWDTMPERDISKQVEITKPGALPHRTVWQVEVTDWIQDVSNGEEWYGFRIGTLDTEQRWIYSKNNSSEIPGPQLYVEYADEPDAPDSLAPNEGVVGTDKPDLTFDYVDFGGSTTLAKVQVQTSSMASMAVVAWDSGEKPAFDPVVKMSEIGYPGATMGQRVYYHIKAMDGDNLWSDWSPVAWFIYEPLEALTLLTPNPSAPLFTDTTPDISWYQTGIQTAYRINIYRAGRYDRLLYTSGTVPSSQSSAEIPKGVLRWDKAEYDMTLRTWDDRDRVRAPNSLPYNYLMVEGIALDEGAVGTRVDSPQAEQLGVTPNVEVTWTRSSSADAYEIARQEEGQDEKRIVERILHEDAIQQDGAYKWVDRSCPPKTSLRYIVRPVTNGVRTAGRPTSYFESDVEAIWLTTADGLELCINGSDQGTWKLPENATAHRVIGSRAPVVIRELHSGYEVSLDGLLIDEERYQPHLTAQEKYRLFLKMKVSADEPRLIAGDQNIPVRLVDMDAYPTPYWELRYECSFTAYQYGEVWWEDPL